MLLNLVLAAGETPTMSLLDAFIHEWFVNIPMVLMSIFGFGVFGERIWALKKIKESYGAFHDDILGMVNEGKFDQAVAACEGNFPGELYGAVLRGRGRTLAGLMPVIERKMAAEMERVKKLVWFIGSMGTLTPFIGLLGTVVGIIVCFQAMASGGGGGMQVVGPGIASALVATGLGLCIGIFSVFCFNVINVKIGHLNTEMRNNVEELAETVVMQAAKAAPRKPTATTGV